MGLCRGPGGQQQPGRYPPRASGAPTARSGDQNRPQHCRHALGAECQWEGAQGSRCVWTGGLGPAAGPSGKELLGEARKPTLNSLWCSVPREQIGKDAGCPGPRPLSPPTARFQPAAPSTRPVPPGSNPDPNLPKNTRLHSGLHQHNAARNLATSTRHTRTRSPQHQTRFAGTGAGVEAPHPEHPAHPGSQARTGTCASEPTHGLGPQHTCTPSRLARVGLASARTQSYQPCNWETGFKKLKRMRSQI